MATGTVKWFNDQKGYGFIQPDNGGKEVFVHISAVERAGLRGLSEGQKVSYEVQSDRRTGKESAVDRRFRTLQRMMRTSDYDEWPLLSWSGHLLCPALLSRSHSIDMMNVIPTDERFINEHLKRFALVMDHDGDSRSKVRRMAGGSLSGSQQVPHHDTIRADQYRRPSMQRACTKKNANRTEAATSEGAKARWTVV